MNALGMKMTTKNAAGKGRVFIFNPTFSIAIWRGLPGHFGENIS